VSGAGVERGTVRFDDLGVELAAFTARGAAPGPRLCLLAGIHGGEYSSIAAVVRFMRALDPSALSGTIVAVPVASPTSFRARSPFVVPEDRKNLNRAFPGNPAGSFTDRLAHHLFETFIRRSHALLDLHGGDMVEALCPFALYDESAVEEKSAALAAAFGLPYVVRTARGESPVAGTTSAAAADAGIPAAIAEAGGRGLLEEDAVRVHLDGIANTLRHLGMLAGAPRATPGQRRVGRFVWLRSRAAGWWEPAVAAGDEVAAGATLGAVLDPWGDELERVTAPAAGVALFVTSSPAVDADGLLLGLGADIAPA
jgi:predicted deacylase